MATEAADADVDAYEQFLQKVQRIHNVKHAGMILSWDQQVTMPEGGTPARSQQSSTLSAISHELLTDDEMGELLDELEDRDLDDDQQAVVRETRREYERAARVPNDLVEELTQTTSEALPKWEQAKEEDDFSIFAPTLEKLVELRREYAEHIDPDRDPYEVLFEEYEPYLGIDTAERVLTRLREELVPLIDDIDDSDVTLADPFEGTYDDDTQHDLVEDALSTLG